MAKRYTIQVRVVEIDDEGNVVEEWSGWEMDIATTDPNAFGSAMFAVACEKRVERMVLDGEIDQTTLSKARPASSLQPLWFVNGYQPPLRS